ncbi:MAG: hypothetical protein KF718_08755 [Polyangiaceae bacterium]|nr:hypothetical protein [Polyangiaceae bacterium]
MNRHSWLLVALVPLAAGCKKKDQPARDPHGFQQGQTGPQTGPGATADPQQSPGPSGDTPTGQAPPLGAIASDPSTLQGILSGALAGGAASLGALTGGELATISAGIKMQADKDAKGKKPEGQLMSASLQQDGHAQASFTLEPNRCYTIVGFAGFGVLRYQINVLTAPPAPPQVLAQSNADGNSPTVGPNDQCLRNPTPVPMPVTVDMHVLQGQGTVGAQVYKK